MFLFNVSLRIFLVSLITREIFCELLFKSWREGDACNRDDQKWYPYPNKDTAFLFCHRKHGVFIAQDCGKSSDGRPRLFNSSIQQCVWSAGPAKELGCNSSNHCPPHSLCSASNACTCESGYLNITNECWPILSVNNIVCHSNDDCSAWPGAQCHQGTCTCPKGTMAIQTNSGLFCSGPDRCPLGGALVAMSENQGCGKNCSELDSTKLPQLYDCVYALGFTRSLCCPNKMFTCMQPAVSGNGPLMLKRYFFNSITDQCEMFEYKGGSVVNSNVFETAKQCQNYCQTSCKRGNPQKRTGKTVHCNIDSDCGSSYNCFKRSEQSSGTCCPNTEFVCSAFGGLHVEGKYADDPFVEFDAGMHPENPSSIYFPVVRYYFSMAEMKCKAFLYHGMGGNFNNFLTLEQCQKFCGSILCDGTDPVLSDKDQWKACEADEQCPLFHQCTNKVCCFQKMTGSFCPSNSEPVLLNGTAFLCNSSRSCPSDSNCKLLDPSHTTGICCKSFMPVHRHMPHKCPGYAHLFLDDATACGLGDQEGCSKGSICSFESINETVGVCCSAPVDNIPCPMGMAPVFSEQNLQQCSPLHLSSCPQHGVCVFNELLGIYYCCSNAAPNCPSGYKPLIEPNTYMPIICLAHKAMDICPGSSKCFADSMTNNSFCCEPEIECPKNSFFLLNDDNSTPSICSETCPEGYFCHGIEGGVNICCSEDPLIGMCDHGRAFTTLEGRPYKCSNQDSCPKGYNCIARGSVNICCPRSEQICSLPRQVGTACQSGFDSNQYYFNTETRLCEAFVYKGCLGNDNRFDSHEQCQAFCHLQSICHIGQPLLDNDRVQSCNSRNPCPDGYECLETELNKTFCCPSAALACFQPKNSGDSCPFQQSFLANWYFDPKRIICEQFKFNGCGGNLNRFVTKSQCQTVCLKTLCVIGSPVLSDNQVKQCLVDSDCGLGYRCQPLNKDLPSVCCPKAELICDLPQSEGEQCGMSEIRYAYHSDAGQCRSFKYLGCRGNENSFLNRETCQAVCEHETNFCPVGSAPYFDSTNKSVALCNPNKEDTCPVGYSCEPYKPNVFYCCKIPLKCLSGKYPFVRSNETKPFQCLPGHFGFFDGCQPDHSCELTTSGEFYCCPEPSIEDSCSKGGHPHVHFGSSKATKCFTFDTSCPIGFKCEFNENYRHHYCCRSKTARQPPAVISSGYACHDGTSPYVDPNLKTVRICSPYLRFSCPVDHECIFNSHVTSYQCCLTKSQSSQVDWDFRLACPAGLVPFLDGNTGRPVICQPAVPGICPYSSLCQYSPLFWQFICCSAIEKPTTSSSISTVLRPGDIGCQTDEQCSLGYAGSTCNESVCMCPKDMILYMHSCVNDCPPGYWKNVAQCQLIIPNNHWKMP